jgi:hypothetical protein
LVKETMEDRTMPKKCLLAITTAGLLALAALILVGLSSGNAGEPLPDDGELPSILWPAPSLPAPVDSNRGARSPFPDWMLPEPAELGQLRMIQRQTGSPRKGTIFDDPAPQIGAGTSHPTGCGVPQDAFGEAYRRLNAQARDSAPLPFAESADAWQPGEVALEGGAAMAAALRQSARQLESTAADLEEQQEYERADRLRQWAKRLRHEARDAD